MSVEQIAKVLMGAVKGIEGMEFMLVAGIPTVVVEDHNQSFYPMQKLDEKLNMNNATCLNVDGHNDMNDQLVFDIPKPLPDDYYTTLSISDFNCAAAHYGFISELYWENPHLAYIGFSYLGSVHSTDNYLTLRTTINEIKNCLGETKRFVEWGFKEKVWWNMNTSFLKVPERMKIINDNEFNVNPKQPFYMNIELDAFCCDRKVDFTNGWAYLERYDWAINRLTNMIKIFNRNNIKKPDLLIICRAQGTTVNHTHNDRYVPAHMVDGVQKHLIKELEGVYN